MEQLEQIQQFSLVTVMPKIAYRLGRVPTAPWTWALQMLYLFQSPMIPQNNKLYAHIIKDTTEQVL